MLPFTKRPGRGDESGDHDVVTKDDLVTTETVSPRTAPPRGKFASLSDDEMTNVIPSKAIDSALESARAASPRPAAGMPPAAASSGRTQLRAPGASSAPLSRRPGDGAASRSGKFAALDDEEEDGRTVVRGAPKIVKRAPGSAASPSKMGMPTSPTTISPAAVIKATLDAARAAKRNGDHLMAPPPRDLLEDLADMVPHPSDGASSEHTKIMESTGASSGGARANAGGATMPLSSPGVGHGSLPPSSVRPASAAPPGMLGHTTNASGGYPAQQSGPWAAQYNGPVPSGSVSVPGVAMPSPPPSMPAHFMMAQAPYSDARMDPPGTSITARTKVSGRPAMSWAVALMAFGLFVGVGAFAVMKGNNGDGVMETSASFVDPARAGAPKAAAAAQPAAMPVAAAGEQVGVPGVAIPAASALPPGLAGALGVTAAGMVPGAAPGALPGAAAGAAGTVAPAVAQPPMPVAAAPAAPAAPAAKPAAVAA
ncbi:MAG: Alginate regulatory protein AlgP, partial [Labilithrix sp.]|nr:Alginate regulatory protein AlgP [Labilithrix sp.]